MQRILAVAAALALSTTVRAQEEPFGPPREHPWGKFSIGTWIERAIKIEHGQEKVEGTMRMEVVDKNDKELSLLVSVSTGEQKRAPEKRPIALALTPLRPEGEEVSKTTENLEIAGETHECDVREFKRTQGKSEIVVKVWFSPKCPGSFLRSESTASREGKHVKVVRHIVKLWEKVKWGEQELTCQVREEVQSGDGPNYSKTMWECADIPGGELRSEVIQKGAKGERRIYEMVTNFEAKR